MVSEDHRTFNRASFSIHGTTVTLDTTDMRPVSVRYAFEAYPQCVLYNGANKRSEERTGIAASPFRFPLPPASTDVAR